MRTEAPLLAPIFRSDGQARLLSVVLIGGDEVSVTDLANHADVAYPTAHREVARLLAAGILRERQIGRTRLISGNPDSPIVAPLREILLIATGPVVLMSEELEKIPGVTQAFIYGSFAARALGVDGPAPRDVDVMVIGDPDPVAVYAACTRVEKRVGRPINPTILSEHEWSESTGFLDHVRASPRVPLVGSDA